MESNQQFSLRWNNYLHHITDAFDSLREDETLVDVTLCCEGKKIKAHRMLLSACSSYFREIFKENPCQHPVVVFHNVRYEDLLALVAFMYRGEVNVEQECLSSFLNTAELLEVKGLTCSTGRDKVDEAEAEECAEVKSPRKQSSPKPHRPESPGSNRKRKVLVSEEPPSPENHSPLARVKAEFSPADLYTSELHSDSMDQRAHSLSHKIKLENTLDISFSGENSDGTSEQPDTLGLPGGSSNDMTGVPEALQVMPFNAWSHVFEDGFEGKCDDISLRSEDMKINSHEKKALAHGLWRRLHPSLKRFGCDECGKVFKHPRSLDHHKKMHEGRTTCPYCRRVFGRMYALRLHITSCHPGLVDLLPSRHSTKSH